MTTKLSHKPAVREQGPVIRASSVECGVQEFSLKRKVRKPWAEIRNKNEARKPINRAREQETRNNDILDL